jgi:sigma-B regulation protein RsbU (phosphoserine phosphatase)
MSDVEKAAAIDFENLFENAPCGYLAADPRGRMIRANRTLLKWISRERSEVEGRLSTRNALR